MTNVKDFISTDNLLKMSKKDLMDLWGLLLSDHEQAWLVDRIKTVLDDKYTIREEFKNGILYRFNGA